MTDAVAPISPKPEVQAWLDAWKSCTQDVLSQIAGQANVFEVVREPLPANDSDLRYTVAAAGAVEGEMAIRLSEASGVRLARKFVGEPGPAGEESAGKSLTEENREALEELLRQIGGLAATTVGASVGGPVQLPLARAEAPWAWTSDHVATIRTRDEGGSEIALEIRISPALAAGLAARAAAKESSASAPPLPAESAVAAVANVAPPVPGRPATETGPSLAAASPISEAGYLPDPPSDGYRRLLDVGLGVKLRFGTRRMLLRDVLALSSGLVVELENKLNSPVDLLLDGRVIARGEVVVIDGKYGLRVTDVVDPAPAGSPA